MSSLSAQTTVTINHTVNDGDATYRLKGITLKDSTLALQATSQLTHIVPIHPTANATLDNCVIGADSKITIVGCDTETALLRLNGSTTNKGLIDILSGISFEASPGAGYEGLTYAEIDIGKGTGGATFENRGVIHEHGDAGTYSSALIIAAKTPAAKFVNNGVINLNPWPISPSQANIKIDVDMLGTGKMIFAAPMAGRNQVVATARAEVDRTVGSGQVFDMTNDGTLTIGDLKDFHGTIKGFSGPRVLAIGLAPYNVTQDALSILGAKATGVSYKGTAAAGTLTLDNGTHALGSIHMEGDYRHATFSVAVSAGSSTITLAA